jgi:tetratricopeptide (TPR) repeat protein
VAQAEADLGAAERERALREQDERLRERLVELRIAQTGTLGNRQREVELDAQFAQAFHDYGVDLEGDDVVPALKRIRERAIAEEVALALDDWGRVRRKVQGAKSEKAENLFVLSMDLDADPERQRMRQAIADSDLPVLLELAAPENLPKLAPGSIFVLSAALWDGFPEHKPDVYRIYDQALRLYPGDYVLQSVGGNIYDNAGRVQSALMCRSAALSLRPRDANALFRFGESLSFQGRLTDAEGAFRACIAVNPARQEAHWSLGVCLNQLGDRAGALQCYTRALELGEDFDLRADCTGARFFLGLATREEVEAMADAATTSLGLLNLLYPLVDHPDPRQRDPQFVLRMIEQRGSMLRTDGWFYILESVARARAEDWTGALKALEGNYFQSKLQLVTPNAFDFLRSLIYSKLGNVEAARETHARGVAEWSVLTGGNPAAWERSDVMRWRREAEAALPK